MRRVFRAVVVAVVAATALACGGGTERSVEAFCDEVTAGAERMTANVSGAGDDAGALLLAAFSNMGEYTRILDRMADRAPDEIRSETEAVSEMWSSQAENAGEAVENPLGALGSALATSVLQSGNVAALDDYTAANCGGIRLFAAPTPTADGAQPVDPCPWLDEGDLDGARVDTFVEALEAVAANSTDTDAADAADELASAVDDAEGASTFERLARLRWDGDDLTDEVRDVDAAVDGECGRDAVVTQEWLDDLDEVGPQRTGDGVVVGTFRRECASYLNATPLAVGLVRVSCVEGETGEVLDVATGELERVPTVDCSGHCEEVSEPTFLGDHVAYTRHSVIPASGLEPELHRHELLVGGLGEDSAAVIRTAEKPDYFSWLTIIDGVDDRIAFSENVDEEHLRIVDVTGAELASWPRNSDGSLPTFDGAFIDGYEEEIVDMLTLTKTPVRGATDSSSTLDRCWDTHSIYARSTARIIRRQGDGTVSVFEHAPGSDVDTAPPVAIVDGVLYRDRDLVAFDLAGNERWRIDQDIFTEHHVFGGRPYVVNTSGELVAVDPATGTDAGAISPHIEHLLLGSDGLYDTVFDHATGDVAYLDGRSYVEVNLPECRTRT